MGGLCYDEAFVSYPQVGMTSVLGHLFPNQHLELHHDSLGLFVKQLDDVHMYMYIYIYIYTGISGRRSTPPSILPPAPISTTEHPESTPRIYYY